MSLKQNNAISFMSVRDNFKCVIFRKYKWYEIRKDTVGMRSVILQSSTFIK